jgi:hypothetical protein
MKQNPHDEARELLTISAGEALPAPQQRQLQSHLEVCTDCRNYAEAAARVVRGLHSLPVAADSRLVRATQMRVRFHADRLRQAQERMWLTAVLCLGVGFSAALTAPLLWRLFAWIGEWAAIPGPIWQAGFVFFGIAPALVVSVLLLARGTQLADAGRYSPKRERGKWAR